MASKGARTRANLVHAAIARFAVNDYPRVSLADIAADAGVSATAIYRYFPDKEALFEAAVDADAEALVSIARAQLSTDVGPSLIVLLDLLSEGIAAAVHDHPLVGRVLAGDRTMPLRRVLQVPSLVGLLRSEIAGLLEVLRQQGLVRTSLDPATTAMGLETVVISHITELAASGTPPEASYYERWQAVVGLVEAALRP